MGREVKGRYKFRMQAVKWAVQSSMELYYPWSIDFSTPLRFLTTVFKHR